MKPYIVLLFLALIASSALAHEGSNHAPKEDEQQKFEQINSLYKSTVKPIFKRSCFDCHSQQTRYPWYHILPGARGLIDRDISDAKKHVDFTSDFPFKGHGSPKEDLEAIRKSVANGSMPPFRYRILHWGSRLSDADKKTVNDWVEVSLNILESE